MGLFDLHPAVRELWAGCSGGAGALELVLRAHQVVQRVPVQGPAQTLYSQKVIFVLYTKYFKFCFLSGYFPAIG